MQPGKLQRSNCFYLPKGTERFFFIPSQMLDYHEGPDPVNHESNDENPIVKDLAKICYFVRQLFQLSLRGFEGQEREWNSCFSSERLKGQSFEFAISLNHFFKCKGDLATKSQLIFHDVASLPGASNMISHVFQILNVQDGSQYLVDLTIRQYVNKGLRLRENEIVVFDKLLKDGFIELTQENFEMYLNFFISRSQFDKCDMFLEDQWILSENSPPFNLETLLYPTYTLPILEPKKKQITEQKVTSVKKRRF